MQISLTLSQLPVFGVCLFLQARSEATLYHDLMGRKTTSLSADMQVNGLCVLLVVRAFGLRVMGACICSWFT